MPRPKVIIVDGNMVVSAGMALIAIHLPGIIFLQIVCIIESYKINADV